MFCFTEFVVFVVTSYKYMWDVGTPHNAIMSSKSNESEPGVRYLLALELYFLVLPTMYVCFILNILQYSYSVIVGRMMFGVGFVII